MSRSPIPEPVGGHGFTLLEVLISLVVLTVALLSLAALAAKMMGGTRGSQYIGMAATLASAKLEDLNRWNSNDPQICVPTGSTTAGSLSSDSLQSVTCGGAATSISYYDDVSMNVTNTSGDCPNGTTGCFAETTAAVTGGNTVYYTTYHSPDGTITYSPQSTTAPTGSTFHRRWLIESNPAINGTAVSGVRRITVLVTSLDNTVRPPVSFQMSMVRP